MPTKYTPSPWSIAPCPFCGSKNVGISDCWPVFSVECLDCETIGPCVDNDDDLPSKKRAVSLWNRRTAHATDTPR